MRSCRFLVLLACTAAFIQHAVALVQVPPLSDLDMSGQPPVTNWLLVPPEDGAAGIRATDTQAWQKIGTKLWSFLSNLDHDFVDARGRTTPPPLAAKRIFGPSVSCGRFARQWIRIPFHDCGTYDVGNTGSEGSTSTPRFGCNGSLRKEMAPCMSKGPECVAGFEARFDLATGEYLKEHAFASLERKYGKAVDWGFDSVNPRMENGGMSMSVAFFYQVKLEAERVEPEATRLKHVSMADIMMYAGMLAVAKCGGPHIVFQPGRPDSTTFDDAARLPNPVAPVAHTVSYFWTNGLTNFDMVNLLAAHSVACFSVGCLDSTPGKLDPMWARQLITISNETDPRICKFSRDMTDVSLPSSVTDCSMPSDTELNARPDVAPYLYALSGFAPISAVASAPSSMPACKYQPGIQHVFGNCDAQADIPPFQPFKVLSAHGGPVNMCNRPGAVCNSDAGQSAFNNAFATSYFKMSKMYPVNGINQGAPYGVQTQPCQSGLIKVGEVLPPNEPGHFMPPHNPNPRCMCCPQPPPQRFYFAQMPAPKRIKADLADLPSTSDRVGEAATTSANANAWAAVYSPLP